MALSGSARRVLFALNGCMAQQEQLCRDARRCRSVEALPDRRSLTGRFAIKRKWNEETQKYETSKLRRRFRFQHDRTEEQRSYLSGIAARESTRAALARLRLRIFNKLHDIRDPIGRSSELTGLWQGTAAPRGTCAPPVEGEPR